MRSHPGLILPLLLAALVAVSCGPAPEGPDGDALEVAASEGSSLNGSSLNGSSLNGSSLNGSSLNGSSLNGSSLNGNLATTLGRVDYAGVKIGGSALEETWLEGSEHVGRNGNGSIVRGAAFLQAEFQGALGDGRAVRLRVKNVIPPAAGGDVWRYEWEYRDGSAWFPVCKVDPTGSVPGVSVNGRWDLAGTGAKVFDGAFTIGCQTTSAIWKCVALGYKPWQTVAGTSLDRHHQACVRLIRADYCGDGRSWTTDGMTVNVWDALGVQTDTEDWYFEAEWDENGARCFSQQNRSAEHVACWASKATSGCGRGNLWGNGALLVNETLTRQ